MMGGALVAVDPFVAFQQSIPSRHSSPPLPVASSAPQPTWNGSGELIDRDAPLSTADRYVSATMQETCATGSEA